MNSRDPFDDLDLAASIAAALLSDVHVPSAVTVDVSDGVVTLEGRCEDEMQRIAAERVANRFEHRITLLVNAITLG